MRRLAHSFIACALLTTGAALAQTENPVTIDLEVLVVTTSGERVPATEARPGQTVEYRLTATNVSSSRVPAGIVVLNMPVVDGVSFLAASIVPDPDVRVEFFDAAGTTSNHGSPATKEVRWTYLRPLDPGESFQVAASVRVNSDPRPAPAAPPPPPVSPNFERDMNAFTQAMFGHLGVIQIPCPSQVGAARVCGETRRDYDSFIRSWDLRADWASELPVAPPTPTSAWQRLSSSYDRAYLLAGRPFVVSYRDGLVVMSW